ncbi:MAG: GNAT family N-acetyltransferase [Bacillaceae bacterium]
MYKYYKLTVDEDITIKIFELKEADQLFELSQQSRSHLTPWFSWIERTNNVTDTKYFIQRSLKQLAMKNGFHAGIWYKEQLVGVIGLQFIDWLNRRTTIGMWISPDLQGKGIMSKSIDTVLKYVFIHLELHRVEVRCQANNLRTQNLLQKLQFTREGFLRQAELLHGKYVDVCIYSILRDEYLNNNKRS